MKTEQQLPKNIRQIGSPAGHTKVYIEDYVITFLNSLSLYLFKVLKTNSAAMIKALTIGNKNDLDESLQQDISNIGISHLFVISGLHINILAMCIKFILKKVHLKEYKIYCPYRQIMLQNYNIFQNMVAKLIYMNSIM